MKLRNPISFTPLPVTVVTATVYVALAVALLVVHHGLPPAKYISGINLDEAWLDLQNLSSSFHPYNCRSNDAVRAWLLERIQSIVEDRDDARLVVQDAARSDDGMHSELKRSPKPAPVTVFSDTTANVSFAILNANRPDYSSYFEGTNIIVYIRGLEDDPSDWWLEKEPKPKSASGVLINAHYDSVSTGYGATDDGIGVVSILQLIKYFSAPGRQPKYGIVALLNNGEEDYLHGARAFSQHPISKLPKTFLNLEGAGAGGRAPLFRSTDTEVTRAYQGNRNPFGNVLSADAFKRGFIKSETDYKIFTEFGMRGLDVAFYQNRARYHTDQDDAKHTSKDSLYHMLSGALTTMQALTDGPEVDGEEVSDGVWFDLFGSAFAVFQLHTLFALQITLLVVSAFTLSTIGFFLHRTDRDYILSGSAKSPAGGDPVSIRGRRGVARWPIAFILASAVVIGLAFLVVYCNPYIVYSSPYAVWSMMLSAWLVFVWGVVCIADKLRPTAFQRLYTIMWIGLGAWILHVASVVVQVKQGVAGTFLAFFYHASVFFTATICLSELFGLPKKTDYVHEMIGTSANEPSGALQDSGSISSAQLLPPSDGEGRTESGMDLGNDEEDDIDERTSLLRGGHGRTTFKHYKSPNQRAEAGNDAKEDGPKRRVYGLEQPWSHGLPSSLWILEFFLIAPFPFIIIGQTSLLLTTALSQTLADGSSASSVYLAISVLSILLLTPLGPFLHRYTYHIPLFFALVFIGTLIYNIVAFPFSSNNRLKISFVQTLDLSTGHNNVTLTGVSRGSYLHDIIASLPSTAHQTPVFKSSSRAGLQECTYTGLPPQVAPHQTNNITSSSAPNYASWLHFNITPALNLTNSAHFRLRAPNTRACKLLFDTPIRSYHIAGSGPTDPRFPAISEDGAKELRLWSRTWDREWRGTVSWDVPKERKAEREGKKGSHGMQGRAVCLWSDANTPGTIPALDEIWKFAPEWVAVTKAGDGLVEGWKGWSIKG